MKLCAKCPHAGKEKKIIEKEVIFGKIHTEWNAMNGPVLYVDGYGCRMKKYVKVYPLWFKKPYEIWLSWKKTDSV